MLATPPAPGGAGSGSFAHSDFRFLPDKNDAGFSQRQSRFASTSSSPLAVHETHGRNLILPLPSPFLCCRKPWPVVAAAGQQCPRNAGQLVGECDGHDPERRRARKSRPERNAFGSVT